MEIEYRWSSFSDESSNDFGKANGVGKLCATPNNSRIFQAALKFFFQMGKLDLNDLH
jgi:hypothetical protein